MFYDKRQQRNRTVASDEWCSLEDWLLLKNLFMFSNFLSHNLGLFKNTWCYAIESKLWVWNMRLHEWEVKQGIWP